MTYLTSLIIVWVKTARGNTTVIGRENARHPLKFALVCLARLLEVCVLPDEVQELLVIDLVDP